jgi:hypothetical protein
MQITVQRTVYTPWYLLGFGSWTRKPGWPSRYRTVFLPCGLVVFFD